MLHGWIPSGQTRTLGFGRYIVGLCHSRLGLPLSGKSNYRQDVSEQVWHVPIKFYLQKQAIG